MARSIWAGVITFGMVSIPIKLYTATENKDIAFHQLHNVCDTRIRYQKYCPHCDRVVDTEEIEKGYEFARGQYVVLNDQDFEKLPLPSKHAVVVSAFVEAAQIDPIYYEKSYYVEPEESAIRPFGLFMKALSDKQVVAIATITLRNKERLCALRPLEGNLIVDTLLYPDEIRVGEATALPEMKVSDREVEMAEQLIELMREDFEPDKYHDHYREALKKLIEAKTEGKEIAVPEAPKAKVVDLMDALRQSVASIQKEGTTNKSKEPHTTRKPKNKRSGSGTAAKSTSGKRTGSTRGKRRRTA
jgi:DNA end-binding protein Ku